MVEFNDTIEHIDTNGDDESTSGNVNVATSANDNPVQANDDDVDSFLNDSGLENESILNELNDLNLQTTDYYNNNNRLNNNMNIVQKLRYWWYQKRIDSMEYRNNILQERGIALYELDDQGNPVEVGFNKNNNAGSNNNFEPIPLPDYNNLRRRFRSKFEQRNLNFVKWLILIIIIVSMVVYLFVQIVITNKMGKFKYNNGKKKLFNPLKKFSNGTHEFNAMSIIINFRSLAPNLITMANTPFLYSLYYGFDFNNNTMVSELIPNFPYNSITQDWCMVTGQLPRHHGIFNDQFWLDDTKSSILTNANNTLNLSKPVWTEINDAYDKLKNERFTISSFGWNNYINDNITYMIDESNNKKKLRKSKDKFNELIDIFDYENITMRPQLNFITIDELNNYFNTVEGGKYKNYPTAMNDILMEMDREVRKFFYQLRHRNMLNFTNVVIVSDIGNNDMHLQTNRSKLIQFKDIIGSDDYSKKIELIDHITEYDQSNHVVPISMISLKISNPTHKNEIYKMLKKRVNFNQIRMFVRDKLPVEFNMTNIISDKIQKRLDDIWLVSQNGYKIILDDYKINLNKQLYFVDSNTRNIDDNTVSVNRTEPLKSINNLRSIFIGKGPFFEDQNDKHIVNRYKPLNNIAIYDMMTEMVGLSVNDQKVEKDWYAMDVMSADEFKKFMIDIKQREEEKSINEESGGNGTMDLEYDDDSEVNDSEDVKDFMENSYILSKHKSQYSSDTAQTSIPTKITAASGLNSFEIHTQKAMLTTALGMPASLADVPKGNTRADKESYKDKDGKNALSRTKSIISDSNSIDKKLSTAGNNSQTSDDHSNWDYDISNWLSMAQDTGEQIVDAGENLVDEITQWWKNLINSDQEKI